MIDFKKELENFKPCMNTDEVEEAIYGSDLKDLTDIMREVIEEFRKNEEKHIWEKEEFFKKMKDEIKTELKKEEEEKKEIEVEEALADEMETEEENAKIELEEKEDAEKLESDEEAEDKKQEEHEIEEDKGEIE